MVTPGSGGSGGSDLPGDVEEAVSEDDRLRQRPVPSQDHAVGVGEEVLGPGCVQLGAVSVWQERLEHVAAVPIDRQGGSIVVAGSATGRPNDQRVALRFV